MFTKFFVRSGLLAVLLLALSACMPPPKPPTVDGSQRQPVNDAATAEMLQLRARLASAKSKQEQAEREKIEFLNRQQTNPKKPQKMALVPAMPSGTHTVVFYHRFPFGVTRLNLSAEDKALLAVWVKNADRVEIRGRTDGFRPASGDEAVAKGRAAAMRRWLVQRGFAADRVYVNYLSAGDYAADNNTPEGQSQNRRVEVHFFSSKPFEGVSS
jgi:outer membrane protein OmpA-like peptidoglycan-associated protein